MSTAEQPADRSADRSSLVRNAVGLGLAVGAYGLSYGALAVSAGLSVLQAQLLSLLLYGGSSQLALVGTLAAGAGSPAAAATGVVLGIRNLFYGVSLRSVLRPRPTHLVPVAHLMSDESAAMAFGRPDRATARRAYLISGLTVFVCWNLATLAGSLAGSLMTDPEALGLDVASSAAFLALVAPRLKDRAHRVVFALACLVSVGLSPFLDAGLPVVLAGTAALSVLLVPEAALRPRESSEPAAGRDLATDDDTGGGERQKEVRT